MRVYYFGCIGQPGHYMWPGPMIPNSTIEDRRAISNFLYGNPWGTAVDGGLCPRIIGDARVHHKDGWTAVAFIDNTVDNRPGSNSVFLAEGTHTFEEMIKIANQNFPEVCKRIGYKVRLEQ